MLPDRAGSAAHAYPVGDDPALALDFEGLHFWRSTLLREVQNVKIFNVLKKASWERVRRVWWVHEPGFITT